MKLKSFELDKWMHEEYGMKGGELWTYDEYTNEWKEGEYGEYLDGMGNMAGGCLCWDW